MERSHRSQFEYDGDNAHAEPLRLTADDIAGIKELNPELHTYLPAPWHHALVAPDKNYIRFAKRQAILARWRVIDGSAPEPPYLHRHQVPLKHAVYSRTEAGDRLVNELNPLRTKEHMGHQLLQDLVQASIELGVKANPEFEILRWPEI